LKSFLVAFDSQEQRSPDAHRLGITFSAKSPRGNACQVTTRHSEGVTLREMNTKRARAVRYRVVLRGELGDQFGILFAGMRMSREEGTTVLTGAVTDQAHLAGIIDRTQELGLELISVGRLDDAGGASQERT
jgi:hypothetical protein